jgi:hypothetical protein
VIQDSFFDRAYRISLPSGFQLCDDKSKSGHALTWTRRNGYKHNGADDGVGGWKVPILIPDGLYDPTAIENRFFPGSLNGAEPQRGIGFPAFD